VRSRGKPLALYVFAKDEAVVKRVIAGTSAGGSIINNTLLHCAQGALPFGGTGESGIGNYHGEWGFKTFSHERAVMRQGRTALANLFFPPYTKQKMKMARMSARLFE
jgi:aldehyde dehydrogenase (NAD+)